MLARHSAPEMRSDTPTKQMDESDATSMTTNSTPSPCSNNACLSSSAGSSPSSSAIGTGRIAENDLDDHHNPYSMISTLASSPLRLETSTDNAENAWSDSNDFIENELLKDYDEDAKINTPVKQRSTSWRIEGNALFHESDDDDDDDDDECVPSVSRRSSDSITASRTFPDSESSSPPAYTRSSWSPTSQPQQPPMRPRRPQTARTSEMGSEPMSDFIPSSGHRRRNSTSKCHSSPAPHTGGRHVTPQRSSQNIEPPNSLSKCKKLNRKSLEMPGLVLEDRLSLHKRSPSSSTIPLSPCDSPSRSSSSTWLCRIRLTTFIWGVIIIGFTVLGKSAMIASETASRMQMTSEKRPLQPPMGGLRGNLLMATIDQTGHSHSSDHHVTAKKHSDEKKKKPKGKNNDAKHGANKNQNQKKNKHPKKASPLPLPPKPRSIIHPKSLGVRRMFEDQDTQMYASPFPIPLSSSTSIPKQIVILHDDAVKTPSYQVEQYPAEFTDNTQFYGELDSSDERLQRMELREPYEDGECVPMQDWQTTYHPSCNGVHEIGVEYLGEQSAETNFQVFGTKGYWRNAWRLDLRNNNGNRAKSKMAGDSSGDTVVLKTLKYEHNFEDAHFEHDRIDAVAMERLTSSPHVINVFGFCGHSVLTEYADGPRLGELADKSRHKPLERLKIARDISNGLADVHGIDVPDGSNATFVHLDINPANVVSIGGTLKLNDFNIGIIRRWNTTSQEPCGFPAQYPNPQWRSPEEARNELNLTEKVDIFSMGHIFFRLICGHEPWNKLEPGGKPPKEVINAKVKKGELPTIPESIMNTKDPEVAAIRDAMLECYRDNPKDRPSAREITAKLEAVLKKLGAKDGSSRRT